MCISIKVCKESVGYQNQNKVVQNEVVVSQKCSHYTTEKEHSNTYSIYLQLSQQEPIFGQTHHVTYWNAAASGCDENQRSVLGKDHTSYVIILIIISQVFCQLYSGRLSYRVEEFG